MWIDKRKSRSFLGHLIKYPSQIVWSGTITIYGTYCDPFCLGYTLIDTSLFSAVYEVIFPITSSLVWLWYLSSKAEYNIKTLISNKGKRLNQMHPWLTETKGNNYIKVEGLYNYFVWISNYRENWSGPRINWL